MALAVPRLDDLAHAAAEPVAEGAPVVGDVDAVVEGCEELTQFALGGGLRAAHGQRLAASLARASCPWSTVSSHEPGKRWRSELFIGYNS